MTASESLDYDDLQRLTQSQRTTPGGAETVLYDYDAAGNLTLKDDKDGVHIVPARPFE